MASRPDIRKDCISEDVVDHLRTSCSDLSVLSVDDGREMVMDAVWRLSEQQDLLVQLAQEMVDRGLDLVYWYRTLYSEQLLTDMDLGTLVEFLLCRLAASHVPAIRHGDEVRLQLAVEQGMARWYEEPAVLDLLVAAIAAESWR